MPRPRLHRLVLAAAAAVVLAGCAQVPESILEGPDGRTVEDPAELAQRARASFDAVPRTVEAVDRALLAMEHAALGTTPNAGEERVGRLRDGARYAIWLTRFEDAGDEAGERRARTALRFANTLAKEFPDRVEGHYLRAVAAGLLADANESYGLDAMGQMVDDARRAIELDPSFESAGPLRVLGALYLEAPGPPIGPGSPRRAVRTLERAVELAPDHPGNLLFLAAAYRARARDEDAEATLDRARGALATAGGDRFQRAAWEERLSTLR